jgi:Tfp pilus assembly protein PilO
MTRGRLLIAAAAVLALYVFVVDPLAANKDELVAELHAKRTTLAKQEGFISGAGDARERLASARYELEEMERYIVSSQDLSLAVAKLQAKVQDLAGVARLRISTIKLLPAEKFEGYTGMPIFIDCEGEIGNLGDFLNFLDSSREFIDIETLDVTTTPQGNLRVRMQLMGLVKS